MTHKYYMSIIVILTLTNNLCGMLNAISKGLVLGLYKKDLSKIKHLIKLKQTEKAKEIINSTDKQGKTPLENACAIGDIPMINLILEHTDLQNCNSEEIVRLIPGWSKEYCAMIRTFVYWACRKNNQELFFSIFFHIQEKPYIKELFDYVDKQDKTLLHWACTYGRSLMVKLLVLYGNKTTLLNHKDIDGNTPLHIACQLNKSVDIIKTLVKQGAHKSLNLPNNADERPLTMALSYKNIKNVEYLKKKGALFKEEDLLYLPEYEKKVRLLKEKKEKNKNTLAWFARHSSEDDFSPKTESESD